MQTFKVLPVETHLFYVSFSQAESKDEAEKPSESAEKSSDKTEAPEKVKKEGTEPSEREEESEESGEAKTTPAGDSTEMCFTMF